MIIVKWAKSLESRAHRTQIQIAAYDNDNVVCVLDLPNQCYPVVRQRAPAFRSEETNGEPRKRLPNQALLRTFMIVRLSSLAREATAPSNISFWPSLEGQKRDQIQPGGKNRSLCE